jgi:ankyrin repeat protein
MADQVLKENEDLRRQNEEMKKQLDAAQRELKGETQSSWNIFKALSPAKRDKVITAAAGKPEKTKVRDGKQDIAELLEAAKAGDSDRTVKLLTSGVPVDVSDKEHKETALMTAAHWGNTHTLRVLLANRAELDLRDYNGETAVYKAAAWGRMEVLKVLVEAGAKLSTPRKQTHDTPLIIAAKLGHDQVCSYLIEQGCDWKMVNTNGQTALEVAKLQEQHAVVKAIETSVAEMERRAKPKKVDPNQL